MIPIKIPGKDEVMVENLLLDYNGTLALDGVLIAGVGSLIEELATLVSLYVITADTNGSVDNALCDYPVKIIHLRSQNEKQEKLMLMKQLGIDKTIAIGNGENDVWMLRDAIIGICIMGEEGCSKGALLASDLVIHDIKDALKLLLHQNRMIATLRC